MDKPTMDTGENYDDSLKKCIEISQILPVACGAIKQMQLLDNRFETNSNLKLADQLLHSLDTLEHDEGTNWKIDYVEEYRERLVSGLNNLAEFLTGLSKEIESLSDDQREKVASISSTIFETQNAIVNIVSH